MSKATDEFLATARKRFQTAAEAEAKERQAMLEDLEFRSGKQWPDQVQAARVIDQRPCLTIDKLSGPIRQITNAQRQSRFAVDVVPVGEEAVREGPPDGDSLYHAGPTGSSSSGRAARGHDEVLYR